ncbi:MAG: AMP-binding protein [Leeuwenhoekiella sp.]
MAKKYIHPDFQLNGRHYKPSTLIELAIVYIKEGEPHEEEVGGFLLEWLNDKDYVMVNTSGSTGEPKTIKLYKKHMVNSAHATGKHFKLDADTTALLCLPSRYIAGKMMLVRAMILGWRLDLVPPMANPLDNVFKRYDFCAMTPFQLDNSVARLHLISKLIVGGGPFSESLKKMVKDVDTKVYETYGMTETITHIAVKRINSKKRREGEVPFKTLSKVTVSQDERGCLVIKAPKVSTDPIITNDIVDLISYKKFIWLGRVDNVINSGGIKLFPEQIENKLASTIDVPFFIASEGDEKLGEKLILVMETQNTEAAQIDFTALGKYEVPKAVYCTSAFVRTRNGKVQRGATVRSLKSEQQI